MTGLALSHDDFLLHRPGPGHPERPERLVCILDRLRGHRYFDGGLEAVEAPPASRDLLLAVHAERYLDVLEGIDREGGGHLDIETVLSPGSWGAALRAAGAGPEAARRLAAGEGDFAFCLVRPPGHHALPARGMGFCLLNNVALTATSLARGGERVCILDVDAHHGNGTQDVFYADGDVLFVSFHEYPQYPGTGRLSDTGTGAGVGRTLNFPFPAGTGEATYVRAFDEVVEPVVRAFGPTWILVSAGYDAHRADPITDLGLRARTFGLLSRRISALSHDLAPGRLVLFLEGGYDLVALADSVESTVSVLLGDEVRIDEPPAGEDASPLAAAVVTQAGRVMGELWGLT